MSATVGIARYPSGYLASLIGLSKEACPHRDLRACEAWQAGHDDGAILIYKEMHIQGVCIYLAGLPEPNEMAEAYHDGWSFLDFIITNPDLFSPYTSGFIVGISGLPINEMNTYDLLHGIEADSIWRIGYAAGFHYPNREQFRQGFLAYFADMPDTRYGGNVWSAGHTFAAGLRP